MFTQRRHARRRRRRSARPAGTITRPAVGPAAQRRRRQAGATPPRSAVIVESSTSRYKPTPTSARDRVDPSGDPVAEHTSELHIDLGAVGRNVQAVRHALDNGTNDPGTPPPMLCAVVKADAYGLGAPRVCETLAAAGVDLLAVYTPEQARSIVDVAGRTPVLVLMPLRRMERHDRLYRAAASGRLHLSVHDDMNLRAIIEIADTLGLRLPVHVEVDTGMARGGLAIDEARSVVRIVADHPRLRLAGLYTHFAAADSDDALTAAQHQRFLRWVESLGARVPPDCALHAANSFGVFRDRSLHADMVRVGLSLYGYGAESFHQPDEFRLAHDARHLEHAVRWTSEIVHVRDVPAGTPVGYGSTWTAPRPSRIALVPVGYADGYPVALSGSATDAENPQRPNLPEAGGVVGVPGPGGHAPVVGRVSMDQITLDVTDIAGPVGVGTAVELIAAQRGAPNALPEIARRAGTIPHDLLCRISPRVPRTYTLERAAQRTPPGHAAAVA